MFEKAMMLSKEAFTNSNYDAAYHFLAAALHLAVNEKNERGLMEVEVAATEQLTQIDKHNPQFSHSTVSASARGLESIYTLLARQANTRLMLMNKKER